MFIVELHFHFGDQLKKKITKVEQTIELATETASANLSSIFKVNESVFTA